MEDLGRAMAEGDQYMLGGGNPALIPEVMAVWKQRVRELLEEGPGFDRMLGCYDSPRGNPEFIKCFGNNHFVTYRKINSGCLLAIS